MPKNASRLTIHEKMYDDSKHHRTHVVKHILGTWRAHNFFCSPWNIPIMCSPPWKVNKVARKWSLLRKSRPQPLHTAQRNERETRITVAVGIEFDMVHLDSSIKTSLYVLVLVFVPLRWVFDVPMFRSLVHIAFYKAIVFWKRTSPSIARHMWSTLEQIGLETSHTKCQFSTLCDFGLGKPRYRCHMNASDWVH